jgi:hypothetical protein
VSPDLHDLLGLDVWADARTRLPVRIESENLMMITSAAQKVMAVWTRDFRGMTDRGIAFGASAADIRAAYGKPDLTETEAGSTYLTYNKLNADFTLFDDRLVQMTFKRPR